MKIMKNYFGKFVLITILIGASSGLMSMHAFAKSHQDHKKSTSSSDNSSQSSENGKKPTSVPETPYAILLPLSAVGVISLVAFSKRRKVETN